MAREIRNGYSWAGVGKDNWLEVVAPLRSLCPSDVTLDAFTAYVLQNPEYGMYLLSKAVPK